MRAPRRSGSVYVLVVLTVAITSVLGLSALSLATSRVQLETTELDLLHARLDAVSAVELGLASANTQATAGLTVADALSDTVAKTLDIDLATKVTSEDPFTYTDQEGNTQAADGYSSWITGTGAHGSAIWIEQAQIRRDEGRPLAPLSYAIHAREAVAIGSAAELTVSGSALSSDSAIQIAGRVKADLSAPAFSITGSHAGDAEKQSSGVGVLHRDALDRLRTEAERITHTGSISGHLLTRKVNSISRNTDSEAIYLIETNGSDLLIEQTRIAATLLIDASRGGTVRIGKAVRIEPNLDGMPSLIVLGNARLEGTSTTLSELTRNLNPADAPFDGVSDTDTTDSYQTGLFGLIHVIGNLEIAGDTRLYGSLHVDGRLTVTAGETQVTHDPAILKNIPRGTGENPDAESYMLQPGTWQRIPAR